MGIPTPTCAPRGAGHMEPHSEGHPKAYLPRIPAESAESREISRKTGVRAWKTVGIGPPAGAGPADSAPPGLPGGGSDSQQAPCSAGSSFASGRGRKEVDARRGQAVSSGPAAQGEDGHATIVASP